MAKIDRESKDDKRYIKVQGVDFGCLLEILHENKKRILCKTKGHRAWSGRGDYTYRNPKFIVFEKTSQNTIKECLGEQFEYTKDNKKEIYSRAQERFYL